jgi:hypothetical protein
MGRKKKEIHKERTDKVFSVRIDNQVFESVKPIVKAFAKEIEKQHLKKLKS